MSTMRASAANIDISQPVTASNSVYLSVFGHKFDALVFLAPLFLGFFICASYSLFSNPRNLDQMSPHFAMTIMILFNYPHTFSTLFRTYADQSFRSQSTTLLWVTPIAVMLFNFVFLNYSVLIFFQLVVLLAFYHGMRQDYGWVRMAASRAGESSQLDRYLNSLTIYLTHLAPMVWLVSQEHNGKWFMDGDIPTLLPKWAGEFVITFYAIVFFAFLCRQIIKWKADHKICLVKTYVVISAGTVWFLIAYVLEMKSVFQVVLPTLIHTIPYSFFSFRYRAATKLETDRKAWEFTGRDGKAITYLALCLIGLFHSQVFEVVFAVPSNNTLLLNLFFALMYVPQNLHYILDGFIWKPGRDSNLRRILAKI